MAGLDYYDIKDMFSGMDPISPSDVGSTPETNPINETLSFDTGESLTVDDLKQSYQYSNVIRDYMVERHGKDYLKKSKEEVVDDFVKSMRYFNANTVSTAGEVRFVSKANDRQKEVARKAYQVYDQLGNVFVNDGLFGAVSGVKDYVFAAALDPTNYLGLLTGGIGRAGAAGVQVTGKQAIKAVVQRAGREALKSGATKQAAKEAAEKAGKLAAAKAARQGMSKRSANNIYKSVVDKMTPEASRAIAKDAMKTKQKELFETAATRSLYQTTALDSMAAIYQDVANQGVMLDVGAQEKYSAIQTGFSAFLGGVAGGAQLTARKVGAGKSGLEDTRTAIEKLSQRTLDEFAPILKKKDAPQAAKVIQEAIDKWNDKVAKGMAAKQDIDDSQLVKEIFFGDEPGKIGGLAGLFKDKGYKISKEIHVSDVMTNVANSLTQSELMAINTKFAKYTPFKLGDLTSTRVKLGDVLAARISEAGKTLNVASQMSKMLDAGLLAAEAKIAKQVEAIDEDIAKGAKSSDPLRYTQSVWKRLLVSSPATTAINVAGFGQYYVGQTVADMFAATGLMMKGVMQMGYNPKAAGEVFRQSRALVALQAQKMRNLLDPYTTHDAYLKFLNDPTNEKARKMLFETMAGGVVANAERYGIDPANPVYKNIEGFTNAMNQLTGVRIQDSFTKSQMFMIEMDKHLRLKGKGTLKDALLSDEPIPDDVMAAAMDTTLKSVFAKDYTTKEQPELIRKLAATVETVSNTPGLGTILPFGRFMNNVVATAYQWSPLAAPELVLKPFYKKITKQKGKDISVADAWARMTVGTAALGLAYQYDKQRMADGLGVYDVDAGNGTIIDAKNTYPFSLFLAAGRALSLKLNGDTIPPELLQELGTQVAVGQVASDVQFGNDLNHLLDIILNLDEQGARGSSVQAFARISGNWASGFTRPLDAVNKAVGFAMGTDTVKDTRQAGVGAMFTQSATKYMDNILEAFIDKTDTLTGEELRVATRSGDVYDPNPLAKIFGLTVKPGRTSTEIAYSMSEMQPWTAGERSRIPAYDKMFNTMLAPTLERSVSRLLMTEEFNKANTSERRGMLKAVMRSAKKEINNRFDLGLTGAEGIKLRAMKKVSGINKEIQREATKAMKKYFNVDGSLDDYSLAELDLFLEYADYLEAAYEEAGKL